MTTNDEVVSYIGSPAVARFLESGPRALSGQAPETPGFVVVLNWTEELTRLVPVP